LPWHNTNILLMSSDLCNETIQFPVAIVLNTMLNEQLNPAEATPKTILRTMGVKGLTLFHLKSHLQVFWRTCVFLRVWNATCSERWLICSCDQKYRLGKQSGKEGSEQSKDGKLYVPIYWFYCLDCCFCTTKFLICQRSCWSQHVQFFPTLYTWFFVLLIWILLLWIMMVL
jgi:hypothetical protein